MRGVEVVEVEVGKDHVGSGVAERGGLTMARTMQAAPVGVAERGGLTKHAEKTVEVAAEMLAHQAAEIQERDAELDSFLCPITYAVMVDPVIDKEGNSYERTAIMNWLQTHDTYHHLSGRKSMRLTPRR